MVVHEDTVAFPLDGEEAQTWYRVTGDLRPGDTAAPAPLVVLHGGPGATHDYLLSLADLADDRAVVHYDQLGNGRSTHYPDRGADFWTVDLFVRELHNLVDSLGIADRHHVLGQSWGGFLAQEYALTQPPGLRALVLADTAASFPDFVAEANRLRALLPPEVEETLRRHEDGGHDRRSGVRGRVRRLLPAPRVPARSLAGRGRRGVRLDRARPDRLPHDERPERVPRDRLDPRLAVEGPARRDRRADAARLRPTRRGDTGAAEDAAGRDPRRGDGSASTTPRTLPHVEERERYMQVVGDWLARYD